LRGAEMNITPSFTMGGAWWPLVTPVEKVQTGVRSCTFDASTWSSRL
jgi:hypothetical protein